MYNKLFTSILDSSIWMESDHVRIVWITFLAAMDEDGFVRFGCVENVANRARVSVDSAREAIEILSSPDQRNPDQEHEGRRINKGDGGYLVLNSSKYRDIVNREVAKARNRDRQKRFRERLNPKNNATVTPSNAGVTDHNGHVTQSETEAEAYGTAHPAREGGGKSEKGEFRGGSGDRLTFEEVKEWSAIKLGTPEDKLHDWWLELESSGWLDYAKRPVTNWQAYFTRKHRHWEQNERNKNSANGPEAKTGGETQGTSQSRGASSVAYALSNKKKSAEESLRQLINGASHDAFGPKLSESEKAEKKRLKEIIRDCDRRLQDLEIPTP